MYSTSEEQPISTESTFCPSRRQNITRDSWSATPTRDILLADQPSIKIEFRDKCYWPVIDGKERPEGTLNPICHCALTCRFRWGMGQDGCILGRAVTVKKSPRETIVAQLISSNPIYFSTDRRVWGGVDLRRVGRHYPRSQLRPSALLPHPRKWLFWSLWSNHLSRDIVINAINSTAEDRIQNRKHNTQYEPY